ncbi:SIP domain-containing protein [Microbacterium immunditiarum]|uniref:NADPH-dependent ferric siderophore reductase n=1 Tax=Microbacterium immunditiarum TaxID=337480 RepID=A0A7Y9KIT9_9MICO|nr:SIP domain-containing protein [Microbacterium immunditiarum]NYE20932.1 NADPH-dependent ferric siderophore reductase [Microbacterium immunditiarum]
MSTPAPHRTTRPAGEHSPAACRAPRHSRVQHLITADESSLTDLEALLTTLPLCSTGRVFIEVPDPSWQAHLDVPPRMIVTWLDRSRRTGDPGTGRACAPGQALSRAVTAWADEMMCADDDSTRVFLLGGYLGTADIVDHLTSRLGVDSAEIHAPEEYGLTAR